MAAIKSKCETDARIAGEKAACEKDLAKAQPIVDAALKAASSIKPADVQEVKKLPKPADIIKLIFDVILILFKRPMGPVHAYELSFSSGKIIKPFFESSFSPYAQTLLGESDFLNQVLTFEKDMINDETIEFMQPYLHLEEYNPKIAKGASNAAEGLWVRSRAMNDYHEAAKIVKPKLEAWRLRRRRWTPPMPPWPRRRRGWRRCRRRSRSCRKCSTSRWPRRRSRTAPWPCSASRSRRATSSTA